MSHIFYSQSIVSGIIPKMYY
uniref:Uncharacterized protein n=1 Tax=Anguilla anguilla TaxID=7936 RepID=A0A0E9PWC4_ANGAN